MCKQCDCASKEASKTTELIRLLKVRDALQQLVDLGYGVSNRIKAFEGLEGELANVKENIQGLLNTN